jgi:hypothetical protein
MLGLPQHHEIRSTTGGFLAAQAIAQGVPIPPQVEQALRSYFGSTCGDASRNAAAVLRQTGRQDEAVLAHLGEYLRFQKANERFATFQMLRDIGEDAAFVLESLRLLKMDRRMSREACEKVSAGAALSVQDRQEMSRLIMCRADDEPRQQRLRQFYFDWVWWSLEARRQQQVAPDHYIFKDELEAHDS